MTKYIRCEEFHQNNNLHQIRFAAQAIGEARNSEPLNDDREDLEHDENRGELKQIHPECLAYGRRMDRGGGGA